MQNNTSSQGSSNIIAALIIAFGLICAALIVAHRPGVSTQEYAAVKHLPNPPIAQDSAASQFRSQILADQSMRTFAINGVTHTLTDVKNVRVTYDAKNDAFVITCDWQWQPAMPPSGPQNSWGSFGNDGYGHYSDTIFQDARANPQMNGASVNVTIR